MRKHPHLVAMGARIRSLREGVGVSQEEMAHRADIDRTYWAGIERGERNCAALNLIKIAKALRVDVGDLFPPVAELPPV